MMEFSRKFETVTSIGNNLVGQFLGPLSYIDLSLSDKDNAYLLYLLYGNKIIKFHYGLLLDYCLFNNNELNILLVNPLLKLYPNLDINIRNSNVIITVIYFINFLESVIYSPVSNKYPLIYIDLESNLDFLYQWIQKYQISPLISEEILYNTFYRGYIKLINIFISKWSNLDETLFTIKNYLLFTEDIYNLNNYDSTFCDICKMLGIKDLEYSEDGIKYSDILQIFSLKYYFYSKIIRIILNNFNELSKNPITESDFMNFIHLNREYFNLNFLDGDFPTFSFLNKNKEFNYYLYYLDDNGEKVTTFAKEFNDMRFTIDNFENKIYCYRNRNLIYYDIEYYIEHDTKTGYFLSESTDIFNVQFTCLSLPLVCKTVIYELKDEYLNFNIEFSMQEYIKYIEDNINWSYTRNFTDIKIIGKDVDENGNLFYFRMYQNNTTVYSRVKFFIKNYYISSYRESFNL